MSNFTTWLNKIKEMFAKEFGLEIEDFPGVDWDFKFSEKLTPKQAFESWRLEWCSSEDYM